MTKKFQLSKYISVCVLSFLLLMAMQFVCFSRTVARADGIGDMDTAYPYNQEYFDLFTDSDNLYNPDKDQKNFDIYNYIKSLYKTKISRIEKIPCENSSKYKHGNGSGYPGIICTAGIICTVDGDDPIVKIIPKELFARRGVYLHIGREYGFYVNTQKLEDNSNQSTVFVFDIEKKLLDDTEYHSSQYIIEIRPLFQYKYCFLTSDYGFDADGKSYSELCYKLNCSMSSVVVPKPEVKVDKVYNTIYSFEETKEYFIKDASFGLALFNEQEPNIGDTGYNRGNDYGSFITRININFSGVCNQNIRDGGVEPIVKMGLGYIPYVGNIMSVGETVYEVSLNASNDFRDEISYGDYYSTQYFNSRYEQLKNYSNLTKNGFVSLLSEDEKPLLIGRTNDSDYVKASFTLGMTENWYTRAIDSIKLSIVTEDTNFWSGDSTITSRITAERSTKNYLRTINEKTLSLENSQSFSMLENGCAEFIFDAEYDSDYDLYISNANQMSIKIDGAETSFSDNKATKYLSAGKHIIRIDGKNSDKLKSYVSITPKTISGSINCDYGLTINGKGEYLLKINSLAKVKKLSTANSSVKIQAIYKNNIGYVNYSEITPTSEITHPFSSGDYYVVLKNISSNKKTINFTIDEPITLKQSTPKTVYSDGSNYTFVKFTGDNSNDTYYITFSDMSGLSVVVYKDDDLITNAGGKYYPEMFYRIGVNSNQTIYIGIKNSSSTSNTLTINKSSVNCEWEIEDSRSGDTRRTSEDAYKVTRGTTLTFKLYINYEAVSEVYYSYENPEIYFEFGHYNFNNPANNKLTLTANCPVGGTGICVEAHPADDLSISFAKIYIVPQMETVSKVITGMINADWMGFKYSSIPSYVYAIEYVIYSNPEEVTDEKKLKNLTKFTYEFDEKTLTYISRSGYINFTDNYESLGYTTPKDIKIAITKIYYRKANYGSTVIDKIMTPDYSINSMFAGGSGTSYSPYQITCKRHFENMLSYNTGEYKLMNDLSLYNRSEFKEFKATLDGDYKTITMTIDTYNTSGDIGLFSTNSGTIKYLKLKAKVWSNSYSSEWQNIGAFCGVNKGTIKYCTLYSYFGESSYLDVSGGSYTYWNVDIYVSKHNTSTGGITGNNYGEITYCYNHASICSRGDIGGIAGTSEGYIYSSDNDGRIYYYQYNGTVVYNRSVGGVVGYQYSGTIIGCENFAKISYDYPKCDNPDIQPCMGRLVGSKQGTVIQGTLTLNTRTGHSALAYYHVVLVDTGSLYSSEGYWWFGWHNRFDQKIYAGDRQFGKEN